jgi:hypothetical protein
MQQCILKSQSSCGPKCCLISFTPVVRLLLIFWLWQTVPPIAWPNNWTHDITTGQRGIVTYYSHMDLPSACQIPFFGNFYSLTWNLYLYFEIDPFLLSLLKGGYIIFFKGDGWVKDFVNVRYVIFYAEWFFKILPINGFIFIIPVVALTYQYPEYELIIYIHVKYLDNGNSTNISKLPARRSSY